MLENDLNMLYAEWDDAISDNLGCEILVSSGIYDFIVTKFERGRFEGNEKIPPCNKAILTLRILTWEGSAFCKTELILHRSLEWRLSSFFRCIGEKRMGVPYTMNWDHVRGARGCAKFDVQIYIDSDGNDRGENVVTEYFDKIPDEQLFT